MTREEYQTCVRLYRDEGLMPTEIMVRMKLPSGVVRVALAKATRRKEIVPHRYLPTNHSLRYYASRAGIRMGSIGDVGDALSSEQRQWVVDQMSRMGCESVAEYLTELVRDVHADDSHVRPARSRPTFQHDAASS